MLKKNKISLLLFSIILSFHCNGQRLSGKIIDNNTKKPVEKVNVYVTNKKTVGTSTDKNGIFRLNYNFKEIDSISFSRIGYKTHTVPIRLLQEKLNIVLLRKDIKVLQEISIRSKKKQSRLKYKKSASLKSSVSSFASSILGNSIYISGGDKTRTENSFRKAVNRASEGGDLNERTISEEWSPSLNFKSYNKDLFIYNINSNSFEKTSIKLDNRAYHQMNFYNNEIYVLGGKKATNSSSKEYLLNTIEIVNLDSKKIQIDKVNPHQAVNFSSFVYKDHLIVLGGSNKIKKSGEKVFIDKIHLYNLKTGLWHKIGKMPYPRETSGILIEDKVYLIGGSNNKPSSHIESWDLTNNQWELVGQLFSSLKNPALTFNNEDIYIFENGRVLIYNIIKKTLKEYNINLHLINSDMHYYKDSLYIIGGYREKQYAKEPSSGIYKVDVSEFDKTKINRFKKLIQNKIK